MTATVTPEIRRDILDSLTRTCELWIREVKRGYFEHPDTSFANQLMLEAFAAALVRMAGKGPKAATLIETYIHELQDLTKEFPQ